MDNIVPNSKENSPQAEQKKDEASNEMLKRREALKRIALMAVGTITGSFIMKSCEPYSDYSDYYDYYNYYSNYYSDSYYYYDYYSVYSVYWDSK